MYVAHAYKPAQKLKLIHYTKGSIGLGSLRSCLRNKAKQSSELNSVSLPLSTLPNAYSFLHLASRSGVLSQTRGQIAHPLTPK